MMVTRCGHAQTAGRHDKVQREPSTDDNRGDAFAGGVWRPAVPPAAVLRAVAQAAPTARRAYASGFVGENFLRASLTAQDGEITVKGDIGGAGIALTETAGAASSTINGLLTQGLGMCNVNVEVQGSAGTRRVYSGLVGDGLVMLTETPNAHGATLVGEVGDCSLHLTRIDESRRVIFQGTVSNGDTAHDVAVTVTPQDGASPPCEALVPLLSLV